MRGGAFVLIFFFWAVLTIVTPMLILLSKSSKPDLDFNADERNEGMMARRMMGYMEKKQTRKVAIAAVPMEAPEPAPAPAPTPTPALVPGPVSEIRKTPLTSFRHMQ